MTPLSLTKWCQHFYNNFKKSLRNIVNFLNLKCLLLHKNDSWAQTSLNFAKTLPKISLNCLFKLKRRKKHCKLLKTCLTPRSSSYKTEFFKCPIVPLSLRAKKLKPKKEREILFKRKWRFSYYKVQKNHTAKK